MKNTVLLGGVALLSLLAATSILVFLYHSPKAIATFPTVRRTPAPSSAKSAASSAEETSDWDDSSRSSVGSALDSDGYSSSSGSFVESFQSSALVQGRGLQPGVGDASFCRPNSCRLCSHLKLNNSDDYVPQGTLAYMARHMLFGIITGSFEQFFRVDVGFCTWMAHLPVENVFIFTDKANESDGRPGTWIEPQLPTKVRFSRAQLKAKGYTIHWIRAQYRFIQALQVLASAAASSNANGLDIQWIAVFDDDTFVDVRAMTQLVHNYDVRELKKLSSSRNTSASVGTSEETQTRELAEQVFGDPYTLFTAAERSDGMHPPLREMLHRAKGSLRPTYLGDKGWGGAGHFLNFAAALLFLNKSDTCVEHYMVRRFLASDVTLKRCLPKIGVHVVNDKLLSHCQANYVGRRLRHGNHVSLHAKRDFVMPRTLAMWRLRLYYQAVYQGNKTAYDLLMQVGACAYGYSCKIKSCDNAHDEEAVKIFQRLSGNGSVVPDL